MAWTYTVDQRRNIVFVEASGILTAREVIIGMATLSRDPQFHPAVRILLDYHAVTAAAFSLQTLEHLAADPGYSRNSRRAFYVAPGFLAGVWKCFQSIVQMGHVEVFYDRDQALAWLTEEVT